MAQISLPAINAQVLVQAPNSATHFRLVAALRVVPDHVFDDELKNYVPADNALTGKSAITGSALMSVNDSAIAASVLEVALDVAELPSDVSVVLCVGIEFVQMIGVTEYLVSQNKGLKVVDVF